MKSSSVALCLAVAALAFAGQQQRFEAVEPHMGTLVRIQVYASGEAQAKAAFRAGFARIAQLDDELSDYKTDSEVNRLPGPAGDDLFRVLETAQQLAAETDGAFDITVGPLTRLWRQARREHRAPDPNGIREALAHCGYRKLHLDRGDSRRYIRRSCHASGSRRHCEGICRRRGARRNRANGSPQRDGSGQWRSRLQRSSAGQRGWKIDAGGAVRELSNAAVSTSGDAEQHLDTGGRRYSHIIDPATGMGLTTAITVTVIARRGMEADGLATAISVLGPERGRALAAQRSGVSIVVNAAVSRQ